MPLIKVGSGISLLYNPPVAVVAASTVTWDSGKKAANVNLSGGNLTASLSTNTFYGGVLGNGSGRSSGKYYCEITITTMNPDGQGIGFGNASADLNGLGGTAGFNSVGWRNAGGVFMDNSAIGSNIQTFSQGDVVAMAVDIDAQKVWFRSNNSTNWNNDVIGNQNPATNTGGKSFSGLNAGPYFPMATIEINGDTFTLNSGATAFTLTAPSGFGNW